MKFFTLPDSSRTSRVALSFLGGVQGLIFCGTYCVLNNFSLIHSRLWKLSAHNTAADQFNSLFQRARRRALDTAYKVFVGIGDAHKPDLFIV